MSRPWESRGVTLVELLVTTSLMAMAGAAAVAALAGGVKVWEHVHDVGVDQRSVLITLDRLRRDLQNVRRFTPLHFEGNYDRYEAPAVGRPDAAAQGPEEIGRLGYFLDEHHHRLCRSFVPYRLVRRQRLRDQCQPVLEDVTRLRFRYFGSDAESGRMDWLDRWDAVEPPAAVECTVGIQPSGRAPFSQTLMVVLASAPQPEPDAR